MQVYSQKGDRKFGLSPVKQREALQASRQRFRSPQSFRHILPPGNQLQGVRTNAAWAQPRHKSVPRSSSSSRKQFLRSSSNRARRGLSVNSRHQRNREEAAIGAQISIKSPFAERVYPQRGPLMVPKVPLPAQQRPSPGGTPRRSRESPSPRGNVGPYRSRSQKLRSPHDLSSRSPSPRQRPKQSSLLDHISQLGATQRQAIARAIERMDEPAADRAAGARDRGRAADRDLQLQDLQSDLKDLPRLRIVEASPGGGREMRMPVFEIHGGSFSPLLEFCARDGSVQRTGSLPQTVPVVASASAPVVVYFRPNTHSFPGASFRMSILVHKAAGKPDVSLPRRAELLWGAERVSALLTSTPQLLVIRKKPGRPGARTHFPTSANAFGRAPPRMSNIAQRIVSARQGPPNQLEPASVDVSEMPSIRSTGDASLQAGAAEKRPPLPLMKKVAIIPAREGTHIPEGSLPIIPALRNTKTPRPYRTKSGGLGIVPPTPKPPVKTPIVPKQLCGDGSSPLPAARVISFEILSTWGDQFYVGLSGVELFGKSGEAIAVPPACVDANPRDINVLPEYFSDPRVPENVVDAEPRTCSDHHLWLAPFEEGTANLLEIRVPPVAAPTSAPGGASHALNERRALVNEGPKTSPSLPGGERAEPFGKPVPVGAIRFWNYNKSRVHTARGVRGIRVLFDGTEVWRGELRQAPGCLRGATQHVTWIWFTKDTAYRNKVRASDPFLQNFLEDSAFPVTGKALHQKPTRGREPGRTARRPLTSATPIPISREVLTASPGVQVAENFTIRILSTWGDQYYMGLTGVALIDEHGEEVPELSVTADPRDLNVIPGHSGDYRTPDRLLMRPNQTTDDHYMWLAPSTLHPLSKAQTITFTLKEPRRITSLLVWNYNKCPDDASRGLREILLFADGKVITRKPVILRKAPGHVLFDYKQLVSIEPDAGSARGQAATQFTGAGETPRLFSYAPRDAIPPSAIDRSELSAESKVYKLLPLANTLTHVGPSGFILTVSIVSAYRDRFGPLGGLAGLELLDLSGNPLLLPEGVNVITEPEGGTPGRAWTFRPPGKVELPEFGNSLASPPLGRVLGSVTIASHRPFLIGGIAFRNLPDGGARDFQVDFDGLVLFTGELRRTPAVQMLLMTDNRKFLAQETLHLVRAPDLVSVALRDVS
eukprot:gnl/Chilomastix_cuspidata/4155.p1 GENE.gnl/Chilomastix_cuspidata/4155~~gnl/Chilomastix_cuspidata/4155.p1  ORF type:complete len:1168 (+),score=376.54 gnl/Chilomastix_cuspidata/4155:513-4016(+)